MKSSTSYQPLSQADLDKQVASARNRIKPKPYLTDDLVIVQLADRVAELETELWVCRQAAAYERKRFHFEKTRSSNFEASSRLEGIKPTTGKPNV